LVGLITSIKVREVMPLGLTRTPLEIYLKNLRSSLEEVEELVVSQDSRSNKKEKTYNCQSN